MSLRNQDLMEKIQQIEEQTRRMAPTVRKKRRISTRKSRRYPFMQEDTVISDPQKILEIIRASAT